MCYDFELEYDDDEYRQECESLMRYKNDERTLTMKDLERILCKEYGTSEYDRESGCYHDGKWFSIDEILNTVADYLF